MMFLQIKLLQGAANSYKIATDPSFECWFDSLLVLDDREAYELSCVLEPYVAVPAMSSSLGMSSSTLMTPSPTTTSSARSSSSEKLFRRGGLKKSSGSGSGSGSGGGGHRKNDSIASSTASSSSSCLFLSEIGAGGGTASDDVVDNKSPFPVSIPYLFSYLFS